MTQTEKVSTPFSALGISPRLLDILEANKFVSATPIQHQVIPTAIEGKDIVGIAQTGTGKTLAFGIPMIQRLAGGSGIGLILLPTRELALQVEETFRKIGKSLGIRTAVLIGGASMHQQIAALRQKPHVVVATPGRLADHLREKRFSLDKVEIIVLDEADRMFDIGFLPEIKRILAAAPKERQTMLFSATMPGQIASMAAQHMKLPFRIEVAPAGTASANVEQEIFIIQKDKKTQLLEKLLRDGQGATLVFSRTKHGAKKIASQVRVMGFTGAEIHSNRSLAQRKAALDGFKSGRYRVLVATDIAARGIDVTGISLVINFDLPDNSDDYVHRIGRTGRAGNFGKAISFVTPEERSDIRAIERLIKKTLPILALPELPPRREAPPETFSERGGFRGGRSSYGEKRGGGRPSFSSSRSSERGGGAGGFHSAKPFRRAAPRPFSDGASRGGETGSYPPRRSFTPSSPSRTEGGEASGSKRYGKPSFGGAKKTYRKSGGSPFGRSPQGASRFGSRPR